MQLPVTVSTPISVRSAQARRKQAALMAQVDSADSSIATLMEQAEQERAAAEAAEQAAAEQEAASQEVKSRNMIRKQIPQTLKAVLQAVTLL